MPVRQLLRALAPPAPPLLSLLAWLRRGLTVPATLAHQAVAFPDVRASIAPLADAKPLVNLFDAEKTGGTEPPGGAEPCWSELAELCSAGPNNTGEPTP